MSQMRLGDRMIPPGSVVLSARVQPIDRTHQVDRLEEQLGLRGMSKDTVSRLCRGLEEAGHRVL
jgi:hypothetical protein